MDSPPPNYNPNDSMLSGGTETIMKVMGGGSMTAPNGYNESHSLLSGGIEPIVRVEGGGKGGAGEANTKETDITVRYVTHYDFEDDEAKDIFKKFIETFGSNEKIELMNAVFEREINRLEETNKPLHYVSKPTFNMYNMSETGKNTTKIKFIPKTMREIVVLPAIKGNLEEFFKQILFLRDSHYLQVTKDKKFKLYNNITVVCLEPFYGSVIEERGLSDKDIRKEAEKNSNKNFDSIFEDETIAVGGAINKDSLLKHLYLKLKKDNFNSFFIVNYPYKIIYPRNIADKNGVYFASRTEKEFPQPKDSNDLEPIDSDLIIERNISSMIYESGEERFGSNEYFIISDNDVDPDIHNTDLSFGLNKFIAILELTTEETKTTIVDLNGEFYKIRLASHQGDSDIVYNSWKKFKFTKHEKKLLDDIDLISMLQNRHISKNDKKEEFINKDVADFLFFLGYYNCFNDVSLLTKKECFTVRSILKDLYKYKLKYKHVRHRIKKGFHEKGFRVNCTAVDIESSEIVCEIKYNEDGIRKIDTISIPKPVNFNENPEITEEIEKEALKQWKQNKRS